MSLRAIHLRAQTKHPLKMEVERVRDDGAHAPKGAANLAPDAVSQEPKVAAAHVDDGPVPSTVLTFTTEEFGWAESCCRRVRLSPRAIKRVVNAFKLLKIVWFRPNRHLRPTPDVQQAFIALIALSAAYPNAMRHLFAQLSEALDGEPESVRIGQALRQALSGLRGRCAPGEYEGIVRDLKLIPTGARLTPGLFPTLELVRSLSFVSELGYDATDEDRRPFAASIASGRESQTRRPRVQAAREKKQSK